MKNYIIIALIALMIFAQGVSADDNGTFIANVTASPPAINSISIMGGDMVSPAIPGSCLGVVKCTVTPDPACCTDCPDKGCKFNANGNNVGMTEGTYCKLAANTELFTPCNMTTPQDGCSGQCEYNSNGMWVGPNLGGYAYDIDDGYKMGRKTVQVAVNVTLIDGIHNICVGGLVKMWVDNYDLQNKKEIRLIPDSCDGTTTIFRGNFTMHYWEKPGFYTINSEVLTCEGLTDVDSHNFEYVGSSAACIAPPGKPVNYGQIKKGQVATANGDVEKSTCVQCDIGSGPATLRNIGNTVINLGVSSTHMICQDFSQCTVNMIPVDESPTNGVIYINLGNDWQRLSTTQKYMNLEQQTYCKQLIKHECDGSNLSCQYENVSVYGLPPGPHATNNLSMQINVVPNIDTGPYAHTITISAQPIAGQCCQDHREIAWPEHRVITAYPTGDCVTPSVPTPMCYELDNNAVYLSTQYRNTCIPSPL